MVDLDPLDDQDKSDLHRLIGDHFKFTGSTVAKFVLDDFENQLKNFVKVFPKDYKKVLLAKKQNNLVTK
jgi:glutamate synthase (NADPH/NADH) large chain